MDAFLWSDTISQELINQPEDCQEKQRGQVTNMSVPIELLYPGWNEITKKEQEADKPS